ncbi:hypothetical protein BXG97_22920 [Salmonella enterica subsp. enterica serovar Enteritidis]|nr:hypothetical protein [Salmonella enterica subsp. enterica serovar Enteritidis]
MKTIKIAWLDDCPDCGCTEMDVATSTLNINRLHYGDEVTCPQCGKAGAIECEDGSAFVVWDESCPCPRSGVTSTRPNGEHYCHVSGGEID